MVSITITLIDSDIPFSLPARWGKHYQVIHIETGTYLNGDQALVLTLVPLTNPEINELVQGISPVGSTSFYYPSFQYFSCIYHPVPPSVGSAYGEGYRISEVKKVKVKGWIFEEDLTPKFQFCDCWRLSLSPRRDPILLLPPAKNNE